MSPAICETLAVSFSPMDSLGIYATPAIVYDDERGPVSVLSGVPTVAQLQKLLSPLTSTDGFRHDRRRCQGTSML